MAYYIPLPNGTYVEVPDDVSIDDARREILRQYPQFNTAEARGRSWLERNIFDVAERGYQNLRIGTDQIQGTNPDAFYGRSPEDAAASIARRLQRLDEIPRTQASQDAFRRAQEAEGILGAVGEIAGSRSAVSDVVGESLGTNPVAGAVGVVANVTPVPVLRQILGGLAGALGFPTEFASSRGQALLEAARDAGVDPRDPQALAGLIREINADPERREAIRRDALTRAGIISSVDAAAGYGAGRLATRSAIPRIGGAAAVEGVGGGVGEAAAQLATTGEIDQTEIAAEIVGGGAMGAAGNITRATDPQQAARAQRAAEDDELERALRDRAATEEPLPSAPLGLPAPDAARFTAEALRGERIDTDADDIATSRRRRDEMADLPIGPNETLAEYDARLARRFPELERLPELEDRVRVGTRLLQEEQEALANRRQDAERVPAVLAELTPEDRTLISRFYTGTLEDFALLPAEQREAQITRMRAVAQRDSNAVRQIRDEIAQLDQQIARTQQPFRLRRLQDMRAEAVQRLGDVAQREVEGFRATGDQAPRMTADADRQIGEIQQRIGEDPVALVTSTLPVTEADFRRALPDARERLVARAQQLKTAQAPAAPLRTSFDASQAEGEASPPSRPNVPGDRSRAQGRFEDTRRPQQPTGAEIDAAPPPTAAEIERANSAQQDSNAAGESLNALRGFRESMRNSESYRDLRRKADLGQISDDERRQLGAMDDTIATAERRIASLEDQVAASSRRAGLGSRSASGTSDRPFPDFEEGRDAPASGGYEGRPTQPGESQAEYFERIAREEAEAAQERLREQIQAEWDARQRSREETARDTSDAERANARYRENVAEPGTAGPDGFWTVDDGGMLVNGDRVVVFPDQRTAARWMAGNRQAGLWDPVIRRANSDEVMLRARQPYYTQRDEARSQQSRKTDSPGTSASRGIGGPQFSTLNTDQQPAAQPAPVAAPNTERRDRANAVINARLERLRSMGKQGRLAANAVEAALKDRRFTPEQMLAAFRIAEAFTRVVGGGRAVQIQFRQNLNDKKDEAGGLEPQALIETIKNGPNGVEAVAEFSLSDNALPAVNMTAPHEAFHLLQALFKGSEPKLAQILDRAFPAGKGIDGIDPTILRKLKTLRPAGSNQSYYDFLKRAISKEDRPAELQAYVFGALVDAQMRGEPMSGMTPAIIRMINYFAQMKRQVGALLRGDGVTAAGIMERAARGDYARLDRVQETAGAQASALKPTSSIQVRENPKRLHSGKVSLEDIANFFDRQFRKRETTDPRAYKQAVKAGADEVAYQLSRPNSGLEWYDEDIKDVFRELSTIYPILNDPDVGNSHRQFFTLIAAPMSNGTKAKPNVVNAAIAFGEWLKTGTIPTTNPVSGAIWGQRGNTVAQHLDLINSMLRDPQFRRPGDTDAVAMVRLMMWMQEGHKIRDISAMRAKHGIPSPLKGAGSVDDVRLGAYIFGPKFGPFFANLNGFHDETVDSWASRTFYRHFGQLRDASSESGMADAPKSTEDRAIAKRWLRDISAQNGIDSRRVQAVLWFYEKEVYNALGHKVPLEVFSDGAREYVARHREYEAAIARREGEGRGRVAGGARQENVAGKGSEGRSGAAEGDEEVGPQFSAMDPAALRQFSAATGSSPTFVQKVTGVEIDKPNIMTRALRAFVGAQDTALYGGERRTEKLSDAFVRNAVNRAHPFYLLERLLASKGNLSFKDLGRIVESSLNHSGRVEAMVLFGPPTYDPKTGNPGVKADVPGLLEIYNGRVKDADKKEAQAYFIALRERDLRKKGRKGFIDIPDAEITAEISKAEAAHPEWKEAAALQQKFNEALLEFGVNTGTLTRAKADELAQLFYTPFYRQMETDGQTNPEQVIGPTASDTLNNPRAFNIALKGGKQPIGDLYENIIRNADSIVRAGMKNVAMQQASKAMEAAGLARKIKPGEKKAGSITLRDGGNEVYYQVEDPVLFAAITGLPSQGRNALIDVMARVGSFFRDMITAAPSFMLANLWRGKVVAYVQEGSTLSPLATADGIKQALKGSTALQTIAMQTGFGGLDMGMDPRDAGKKFARKIQRAENAQSITGQLKNAADIRNWLDGLLRVSEATEMAERIKLFEKLRAEGVDERNAAFQAYQLAPFSRRGMGDGWAGKFLAAFVPMVPFLNAKIQGLYRMVENEKGDKRVLGTIPRQIALRGSLLTAFSLAAAVLASDDERWDEETPDRKLMYDIFYVGDRTIYLPRAFEFGSIFGAIPVFMYDAIRREDGSDLAKLFASVGTSTFFFNPLPAAVAPILSVATNHDFFRGRELETKGQQALPAQERVNSNTSSLARVAASIVNNTLGELPRGAKVEMSPIQAQALLDGYLGTTGTQMLVLMDSLLAAGGQIPSKPSGAFGNPSGPIAIAAQALGVRRFVRSDDERVTRFVGDFYKLKEQADQLARSLSDARGAGDIERVQEIMAEYGAAMGARSALDNTGRRIGEINRMMRNIERDRELDADEKRDRLIPLRDQRNMLARQGVETARAIGLR